MRIGHVRVGSDDFMQTSIILRRRHRRLRRVFLTPTTRARFLNFRSPAYENTLHMLSQGDRRVNAPSRKTGSLNVRAGSA